MKLAIHYQTSLTVPTSLANTFAFFLDLPTQLGAHFPGLKSLTATAPATYLWDFGEIAAASRRFPLRFLTEVAAHAPTDIALEPRPSPGAATLRGAYRFSETPSGTAVSFVADLEHHIELPLLLRAVAAPVAQTEIEKLFARYFHNVREHLQKTLS